MKIPMNDRRGASAPSALRVAATALLVSVAYYIGANIGFILRFPPSTPSVLWPPNAILTATLLLAPVSRWWIYLLAAFPAFWMAAIIVRDCSTGTVGSTSPWKAQIGIFRMAAARATLPPPQRGTAAANRSGLLVIRSQVP